MPDAAAIVSLGPGAATRVYLGVVWAAPVAVVPATAELTQAMQEQAGELARRHAGHPPSQIPGLEPARKLYRSFGVDPTRTRPSSEALVRRALQGKSLPVVSNAVDVCNYCSLRFLLPIGLYDLGKVAGSIVARVGAAGEAYAGIRKDEVGLEGRLLLADDNGPFGNPSSDSLRTCVDASTAALLMVLFAPGDYSGAELTAHTEFAARALARYLSPTDAGTQTATALVK